MPSLFAVKTCSHCGQKTSLTPVDILQEEGEYRYHCRRCKHKDVFPEGFIFRSVRGADCTVEQAVNLRNEKSFFSKCLSQIFGSKKQKGGS